VSARPKRMGILLPDDVDWSHANWVGRALFRDLLELGGLPDHLLLEVRFCVETDLDTLDLRTASIDELRRLRTLVESVYETNVARGPSSFHLPQFHPVYLDKLRMLATQLETLLADAVPTN
jgi:hypothetical protein